MKDKYNIPEDLKQKVLRKYNFTCQKCSFQDITGEELEIHPIDPKASKGGNDPDNLIVLCSICHNYAPESKEKFLEYIKEKIDGNILNTFRKSRNSLSKATKTGMMNLFKKGRHITKAPKGYKLVNKQLIIDEQEAEQVRKIYEEFLNNNVSLTQLAKKNNMTTRGIKKLLQNTTYIGKVKFAGKESDGTHKAIISPELFQKVQEKLRNSKKIRKMKSSLV